MGRMVDANFAGTGNPTQTGGGGASGFDKLFFRVRVGPGRFLEHRFTSRAGKTIAGGELPRIERRQITPDSANDGSEGAFREFR